MKTALKGILPAHKAAQLPKISPMRHSQAGLTRRSTLFLLLGLTSAGVAARVYRQHVIHEKQRLSATLSEKYENLAKQLVEARGKTEQFKDFPHFPKLLDASAEVLNLFTPEFYARPSTTKEIRRAVFVLENQQGLLSYHFEILEKLQKKVRWVPADLRKTIINELTARVSATKESMDDRAKTSCQILAEFSHHLNAF